MEKTYHELGRLDAFKKRFGEARTATGRNPQLRLVVCKNHRRQVGRNNLLEKIIEKQSRFLLPSNDAVLIRRFSSGRIVFWNHGAQKLYGWSKKKAMGKAAYRLLETELPEPPREIKAKLRRHGCWAGELIQTTRDGKSITVASYWSLRETPRGGPMEILEVSHQMRDGKRAGHKAPESDRLALIGTMAAVSPTKLPTPSVDCPLPCSLPRAISQERNSMSLLTGHGPRRNTGSRSLSFVTE